MTPADTASASAGRSVKGKAEWETGSERIPVPSLPAALNSLLNASRWAVGALVASFILVVGAADWWVGINLSLGAVYVIPILIASAVYPRWVTVLLAILCAVLRLEFGNTTSPTEMILNFLLVMAAYIGSGFFIQEVVASRRNLLTFAAQLQRQQALRRKAEEQLRVLVESSPAAIMTIDQTGAILAANQAAMSLFGFSHEADLSGERIGRLLPVLGDALGMADEGELFRTAAQCQGRRVDGSPFHAHIWFSTYSTDEGRRLAAIAVDSSDEVREREESNLRQLLSSNRVLTAAVLHEIRNFCGSISTAYANLTSAAGGQAMSKEVEVLGNMIGALGRLASTNLQGASRESLQPVRLATVLDQFRIVAEPAWQELEGSMAIRLDGKLPPVVADPQSLLQVLLNLMANSQRAVRSSTNRQFLVSAELRGSKVVVVVEDSGAGIANPGELFVPFQSGADRVGLGLYLSRALMRSFGGELRHVATPSGCRFEMDLVAVGRGEGAHVWLT